MATEEINIPEAPKCLPAKQQDEWKKSYEKAFRQALRDYPENDTQQRQFAMREANRLLSVPEPKSHEEASALPAHQVMLREEVEGELRIVTTDGKKYAFPVPAAETKKK